MGSRGTSGSRNSKEQESIEQYKKIKNQEVLSEDVTVFRGGKDRKFSGDRAVFTTTNKDVADVYAYKGTTTEFTIPRGSKFLIVDMKGSNWSRAYQVLDGLGDSRVTEKESTIMGSYTRDPLRGIAEVARSRGYDGAMVKNVVDPKGIFKKGSRNLLTQPINEYIVTNTSVLKRKK